MRIFLTGATGYIGGAVLDACLKAGHEVTALVRDARRAKEIKRRGAHAVAGDLGDGTAWGPLAQGFDALVHTALEHSPRAPDTDRQAVDTLIAAAKDDARDRLLVYTSSTWVLGPAPTPVDERAPINPLPLAAWRPAHEALVLDAGLGHLRTAVIRPGIVYGGSRGLVTDLLKSAANGLIRVVGDGRNRWPLVHDRDLADLYVRLISTPGASGVFHANDEGDERVIDIAEAIARAMPIRADIRHVPIDEARAKLGPVADALALDQVVRSPRARALGWAPALRSVEGNVARLLEERRSSRG